MSAPQFDYQLGHLAVLKCPRCGGMDLHHGQVTVFDRNEDEELVMVTTTHGNGSTTSRVPSMASRNPSSRRCGLTIEFYCEACDGNGEGHPITLGIAQHKGWTHFGWRR